MIDGDILNIAPILILAIEIIGIIDIIFPVIGNERSFSIECLIIEIIAIEIIGILILIYFIFIKDKNIGDNDIELF